MTNKKKVSQKVKVAGKQAKPKQASRNQQFTIIAVTPLPPPLPTDNIEQSSPIIVRPTSIIYDVDTKAPARSPDHPFIYMQPAFRRLSVDKCPSTTLHVIERSFRPRDTYLTPNLSRVSSDPPPDMSRINRVAKAGKKWRCRDWLSP